MEPISVCVGGGVCVCVWVFELVWYFFRLEEMTGTDETTKTRTERLKAIFMEHFRGHIGRG